MTVQMPSGLMRVDSFHLFMLVLNQVSKAAKPPSIIVTLNHKLMQAEIKLEDATYPLADMTPPQWARLCELTADLALCNISATTESYTHPARPRYG